MRDPAVLADDIRAHLEAENAHTSAFMADTAALQETLFAEMRGRIKEDDSSVPSPDGPYAYAMRHREGGQHPLFVRMPRDGGPENLLLDGDALAEGQAYFRIGGVSHSPDHSILAWAADDKGSEYYTLAFRDLETGEELSDTIPETSGGGVWAADSRSVFYTRLDENHRPSKVFRHVLGTSSDADVLVYEEPDAGFFVGVGKTQSGDFIVIDSHDHQTSEIRLIDAHAPEGGPVLVAMRKTEVEYSVEHQGDRLIILTNADGAEDFKLVTMPLDQLGQDMAHASWRDHQAHEPGRLILSHVCLKEHLIWLERYVGLPAIKVQDSATGEIHDIAFSEAAYSLGLSAGYEFDTTGVRFSYASPTTPSQVFDYDVVSRERTLRKTQDVPSGHNPADYVCERILAPSHDGVEVPVTLLRHRETPLDGSAPCLLYGYGSYGIAMPAGFSITRLSLVDRGVVYAVAHVRGGKDLGFAWYRDGKRDKKTNTFKDFVAAAGHLAETGMVAGDGIVAQGGSAGGMLMGAVVNMAPERFAGIIAEVPFVDVLNTMLDDTLPLTPPEWPEWGNPIESAKDYATIAAYSPYDNVAAVNYPPILAVAGLTDPRVTYWEPAKWVAKLRATKTDANPLLLKTHMDAGHAGAAGRFDSLKEVAFAQAFALKITGSAATSPQQSTAS